MDRRDFYKKQVVMQAEMDSAFAAAETSINAVRKDNGEFGVMSGLTPSLGSAPNVNITSGIAYDQNGRRLKAYSDGAGSKSISYANTTAGSATSVGVGNERWISIFARFGRKVSDPRIDGDGNPLNFVQDEALVSSGDDTLANVDKFFITAGTEAALGAGVRPSLEADKVLICDIKRTNADGANVLDTSRRQIFGVGASTAPGVGAGLGVIMAALSTWLGGRTNPAQATLTAQLNKIIDDLAATAANDDGAERIGAEAYSWLNSGSVRSQLNAIADAAARLTANNTMSGNNTFSGQNTFSNTNTFSNKVRVTPQIGTAAVDTPAAGSAGRRLLFEFDVNLTQKIRLYLNAKASTPANGPRNNSLLLTVNAVWNNAADNWSYDSTDGNERGSAFMVDLGGLGPNAIGPGVRKMPGFIFFRRPNNLSSPWADSYGVSGGWHEVIDHSYTDQDQGGSFIGVDRIFQNRGGLWQIGRAGAFVDCHFGIRAHGTAGMTAGGTASLPAAFNATPSSVSVTTITNANCSTPTVPTVTPGGESGTGHVGRLTFQTTVTGTGEFNVAGTARISL